MSEGWEDVDRSIRDIDPNLIVIQLDLPRLGELIARVAAQLGVAPQLNVVRQ